jgi:hypothetical protein
MGTELTTNERGGQSQREKNTPQFFSRTRFLGPMFSEIPTNLTPGFLQGLAAFFWRDPRAPNHNIIMGRIVQLRYERPAPPWPQQRLPRQFGRAQWRNFYGESRVAKP